MQHGAVYIQKKKKEDQDPHLINLINFDFHQFLSFSAHFILFKFWPGRYSITYYSVPTSHINLNLFNFLLFIVFNLSFYYYILKMPAKKRSFSSAF